MKKSIRNGLAAVALAAATLTGSSIVAGAEGGSASNQGTPVPGSNAETSLGDRWAVVNANGSVARAKGSLGATRLSAGNYEVRFNRDVTFCVYTASVGLSGSVGVEIPGQISVVRRVSNPRAVFIQTTNSAGTPSDRGFHLMVGCG